MSLSGSRKSSTRIASTALQLDSAQKDLNTEFFENEKKLFKDQYPHSISIYEYLKVLTEEICNNRTITLVGRSEAAIKSLNELRELWDKAAKMLIETHEENAKKPFLATADDEETKALIVTQFYAWADKHKQTLAAVVPPPPPAPPATAAQIATWVNNYKMILQDALLLLLQDQFNPQQFTEDNPTVLEDTEDSTDAEILTKMVGWFCDQNTLKLVPDVMQEMRILGQFHSAEERRLCLIDILNNRDMLDGGEFDEKANKKEREALRDCMEVIQSFLESNLEGRVIQTEEELNEILDQALVNKMLAEDEPSENADEDIETEPRDEKAAPRF